MLSVEWWNAHDASAVDVDARPGTADRALESLLVAL
jgi:hypothetical protein